MRRIAFSAAVVACFGIAPTASAAPAFRDTIVSGNAARSPQAIAEWGGRTVATDGESVRIYFSDSYPVDPALALQWADYLTSLVHGSELSTVSVHLATLDEVQQICGDEAYACYNPRHATIYAPGEDVDADTSAKGVLTHEYGHHVAASRVNPPFISEDYGTKRWASYEGVCAEVAAGRFYPGAEDSSRYMLNPGEAFAESYRVLNEQRLGLPLEGWDVVTRDLFPDETALSLLEQDVLKPWTANTTRKLSATLTAKVRTRTYKLDTPYDGTLTVTPRQTGSAHVKVSLVTDKTALRTSSFARASGASLSRTVCGQRSYGLRARLVGKVAKTTRTTVTLSVSTP